MFTSIIGPLVYTSPYTTGILLSVPGGNCILTPGSPIPLRSGLRYVPNCFAVPIAIPAVTTPAIILAAVPVIPIAPSPPTMALKTAVMADTIPIMLSSCKCFLFYSYHVFLNLYLVIVLT